MRHTAHGQSGPSISLGPLPLVEARLCAALLVALAALAFCMLATPAHAATSGSEPIEGSAVSDGAGFGINGFTRYQKGAERPVGTQDVGYRFPVAEGASFAVVCTPESVLVYIEPEAAEALQEGQISGILESEEGFSILRRLPLDTAAVADAYFDHQLETAAQNAAVTVTPAYETLDPAAFSDALRQARQQTGGA